MGYSPPGGKESDTTEATQAALSHKQALIPKTSEIIKYVTYGTLFPQAVEVGTFKTILLYIFFKKSDVYLNFQNPVR